MIFTFIIYFKTYLYVGFLQIISGLGDLFILSRIMVVDTKLITSPLEGVERYCFHPVCLCVCVTVCVCVSACPANILVFYFSAIRRDIDLKFIQDIMGLYSIHWTKIDLHMSMVKVTGTVHCFLKVQSYHKNWAIEIFQFCFMDTS